jgi:hypothetical protein
MKNVLGLSPWDRQVKFGPTLDCFPIVSPRPLELRMDGLASTKILHDSVSTGEYPQNCIKKLRVNLLHRARKPFDPQAAGTEVKLIFVLQIHVDTKKQSGLSGNIHSNVKVWVIKIELHL